MKSYCGACDTENEDYKQHSLECPSVYNEREDLQTFTTNELEILRQTILIRIRNREFFRESDFKNNDDRVTIKIILEILELRKQRNEDIGNDVAMERLEDKFLEQERRENELLEDEYWHDQRMQQLWDGLEREQ